MNLTNRARHTGDVCLIRLDSPEVAVQLEPGLPQSMANQAVQITLDRQKPIALLEQMNGDAVVKIKGVVSVTAGLVAVGEKFQIGNAIYALVEDKQVFVNELFTADFSKYAFVQAKRDANHSGAKEAFSLRPFVVKKFAPISVFAGVLFSCSLMFASAFFPKQPELVGQPSAANYSSNSKITMQAVQEAAELKKEVAAVAAPTVPVVGEKQPPSKVPVKRPVSLSPQAAKALTAQSAQFQEYLLEARFDPEGSRLKIQKLAAVVPRQSPLRQRIDGYLRNRAH